MPIGTIVVFKFCVHVPHFWLCFDLLGGDKIQQPNPYSVAWGEFMFRSAKL